MTKNTSVTYTIPVVFHIVLNRTQMEKLGGEQGIRAYIDTQLALVNRDFNAANPDSVNIPAAFQPLFGNAGITFALAHTRPDGTGTEGYELVLTDKKGFNIDGENGSGIAFSDAKYATAGGADAWDIHHYLNIWVVNMMEDNLSSDLVGITLSPATTVNTPFEPEIGVALNYRTWQPGFKGRILTHELGHYFSLMHIWGNNAECPGNGDVDDGIADTPPQSDATYYTCPSYPDYDGCTTGGAGIMFMNYMDYTDESCQYMFTKEQVALMRADLASSGISFALTQQPEKLDWPVLDQDNAFSLYPNPTKDFLNIYFPAISSGLAQLRILNILGKTVAIYNIDLQQRFYSLDLTALSPGAYFLKMELAGKVLTRRFVLR